MPAEINFNLPGNKKSEHNSRDKIAVVYARYSSHSQTEQSIEGQLAAAQAYAAAHDYTIVHEYIDRAKSGRTDSREQFQAMLHDTAKKQFGVILVWKVDRFGRNREELTINKLKCKKNGVRVEYIAEKIPDSPEGVILESVLEGFAEYYSLQLSQNVRRGRAESAEKCQVLGGTNLLGYSTGPDKKYVIDPNTAPTVKIIFEMYASGSTTPEIVRHLNSLGLRSSRGTPFTKNSLCGILKNEKYTGVYTYKDKRIPGGIPRIIDDETFQKVQALLKVNKRAPSHKWSRAEYILTDKLFCGKCGSPMAGESGTSHTGAKHNYYLCTKHKRQGKTACDKKAIRQEQIEDAVLNAAIELVSNDELIDFITDCTWEYYQKQDFTKAEVEALQKELSRVETAIKNLLHAIELGIFNEATKARMDELTAQQKELTTSIAEKELASGFRLTRDHIKYFLGQFKNKNYKDRECQKQLINTFVNSVFLYDDHIDINFNYSGGSRTLSLTESEEKGGSEGFVCCLPCSTLIHRRFSPAVVFLLLIGGAAKCKLSSLTNPHTPAENSPHDTSPTDITTYVKPRADSTLHIPRLKKHSKNHLTMSSSKNGLKTP